jgi:hypothetical protein
MHFHSKINHVKDQMRLTICVLLSLHDMICIADMRGGCGRRGVTTHDGRMTTRRWTGQWFKEDYFTSSSFYYHLCITGAMCVCFYLNGR